MATSIAKQVESTTADLEKEIATVASELEGLATEIELKVKLASMDARDVWDRKLEPRLFEARTHAQEAKEASRHALHETLAAFKAFAATL